MSSTIAAVAAGALISGGIGYLSSKSSSKAAEKASDAQVESQDKSMELQLEFLREQRADIAEAVEAGLIDINEGINMAISEMRPEEQLGAIQNYASLLQDPNAIFDRPGVQFQFDQGVEAMQAGFSKTAGGGVSGPSLKAATEYGQNYASLALDDELRRLEPLMNIETAARTRISNLEADRGRMEANLRLGGAAGLSNATGAAAPGMAATITNSGNAQAGKYINQANANTALMSNLAGGAQDLAYMYAFNPGLFSGGGGSNPASYGNRLTAPGRP
jgi:hypothetical protein